MTEPLTEREEKLIATVEWLVNTVHEAHHMTTTDAAGNAIRVPQEHRRRADECGSKICQYGTKVLAGARQVTTTEDTTT